MQDQLQKSWSDSYFFNISLNSIWFDLIRYPFYIHYANRKFRDSGNGIIGQIGQNIGVAFDNMKRYEDQSLFYPFGNHRFDCNLATP